MKGIPVDTVDGSRAAWGEARSELPWRSPSWGWVPSEVSSYAL